MNNNSQKSSKSNNKKIIFLIAAIIIIAIILFFTLATRNPKSAVKDYVKAFNSADVEKLYSVSDYEGTVAFSSLYYVDSSNLDNFEDEYNNLTDKVSKFSEEEKENYENSKKSSKESKQKTLDFFKNKNTKFSVSNIKTEKVGNSKVLTKVTATLTKDTNGEKTETTTTFYTMKKGLKNYIVYSEMN